MRDAGFDLRKWVTNNSVLQSIIDKNENGGKVISTEELTNTEVQFKTENEFKSVLGVKWDNEKDEDYVKVALELPPTKHNIFRLSASIFDTMGFILPVTTNVKIIFQLLCQVKSNWDEAVSFEIDIVWKELN